MRFGLRDKIGFEVSESRFRAQSPGFVGALRFTGRLVSFSPLAKSLDTMRYHETVDVKCLSSHIPRIHA